ncbi:MAG TPA: hypothetical protein VKB93_03225 [Thermoanaerobaculia bacterium]|nr:hypothetical protein [Thermoanaerobaculia bacterium]
MNLRLIAVCGFLLLFGAGAVLAEPATININIQPKASAPLQLAYAKRLMQDIHVAQSSRDRHAAVANATFNLMAVEHGWPNDRVSVREAKACLAIAYVEGEMPRNALEAADAALRDVQDDHRSHYARGWALERLGRTAEAATEYENVVETFDWRRGGFENVRIGVRVTYFFEQAKRHDLAAKILRHAASEPGLAPTSRVNLAMQMIEQLQLSGAAVAKKDVELLRESHRASLGTTLMPAQRAIITRAEEKLKKLDGAAH